MGITTDELRILLSINGAQGYANAMNQATGATNGFKNATGSLISTLSKLVSVAAIYNFTKSARAAWQVQMEAETKLNTILIRNVGATEDQVKAIKNFASELQNVGVIGDEIQLSGLQELATYIENADSLKKMNVVLNDMLAQQYGLNATAENAVTIATMLGKVLQGQTSALSRYGYSFTEAQEQLLKYGNEEQRVATLAAVVEQSVGGMNEALAKTPAGRLKQVSNTMGDIKEQFGKAFTNGLALLAPALKEIASLFEAVSAAAVKVAENNAVIIKLSSGITAVTKTIKLYTEAWSNASVQTQKLIKAALTAFAIGAIAPRIIALVSGAVKILTMEIVTLSGALSAIAGIAGIVLATAAISQLKKQVDELRNTSISPETADNISALGNSAAISTDAVDDLADAMNGLGDATEGLDTFLASFDEVNKVGGNNSLMSNLVNTGDLENILGVADGLGDINSMIDDINSSINNVDVPDVSANTFLDPAWWQRKLSSVKQNVGGFLHTFYTGEWKDNWEIGAEEIVTALKGVAPNITKAFVDLGSKIYDIMSPVVDAIKLSIQGWTTYIEYAIEKIKELANIYENSSIFKFFSGAGSNLYDLRHENDKEKDDTFTYTSKSGIKSEVLKYNPDGTETELYKKYKSMYNEDGTETELYRRMQTPELPKNTETGLFKRLQTPELPKPTKTAVDNSETEYKKYKSKLVDDAESDLKKRIQNYTINQPNIPNIAQTTYNSYQQPSSSTVINNNYTIAQPAEKQEKETVVEFSPTIQLDGRTISAVVINDINKITRSSGKSPLIELGG